MSKRNGSDLERSAHDGLKLHFVHWPSQRSCGVVVMLHGLCEHARRHSLTAQVLLDAGWSVLAPDLRGHGESGGQRGGLRHDDDFLHDLATALDLANELHPGQRLVVLGHSTGGAIAARFASEWAQGVSAAGRQPWARPLHGLMLSSPALQASIGMIQKALLTTMGRLMQDVAMPVMFKPEWFSSDPAVIAEFEQDPLAHRQVTPRLASFIDQQGRITLSRASQWTIPTLLLYTPGDRLIAPQACATFAARAPASCVSALDFPELAHDMLREPNRAKVHAAIQKWLGDTMGTPT